MEKIVACNNVPHPEHS